MCVSVGHGGCLPSELVLKSFVGLTGDIFVGENRVASRLGHGQAHSTAGPPEASTPINLCTGRRHPFPHSRPAGSRCEKLFG